MSERDRLVEEHIALADQCAQAFLGRRSAIRVLIDADAIRGAAREALVTAAGRYDRTRGVPFDLYASRRIWGAMLDECRQADHLGRRDRDIATAEARLRAQLGRAASDDEIAAATGLTVRSVVRARNHNRDLPARLDAPVGDGESTFGDQLADGSDFTETVADRLACQHAFRKLPRRQQLVLQLRYADDLQNNEIAALLGVSESRISQIHTVALARMRRDLAQVRQPAARRAAA